MPSTAKLGSFASTITIDPLAHVIDAATMSTKRAARSKVIFQPQIMTQITVYSGFVPPRRGVSVTIESLTTYAGALAVISVATGRRRSSSDVGDTTSSSADSELFAVSRALPRKLLGSMGDPMSSKTPLEFVQSFRSRDDVEFVFLSRAKLRAALAIDDREWAFICRLRAVPCPRTCGCSASLSLCVRARARRVVRSAHVGALCASLE